MAARTLDDARWSCRSCTACCRGFRFGPVEPAVIEGLQERDIEAHWPPAAEGPWFERADGPDGERAYFLTERDEHCVFLRDDDLCAVHALFGAAAKPAFCREYPFHPVDDHHGVAVIVRPDCGGLHESFTDGEPLVDQVDDVLALPEYRPRRRFDPEQVVILPDAAVSARDWATLEEILLRDLRSAPRSPEASVAAIRDRLRDLVDRPRAAPDPDRYREAMGTVLEAVHDLLHRLAEAAPGGYRADLVADTHATTARALQRLDEPLPALDEQATAYLHLVLRSRILGKLFQGVGGVPFGLGVHLVATTAARAAAEAEAPLPPAAIGPALARFERIATHGAVLGLLQRARPALGALFDHAPSSPQAAR